MRLLTTSTFSNPSFLQINAINAATEAACLVLSVDETVKNPKVISNFFVNVLKLKSPLNPWKSGCCSFHFHLKCGPHVLISIALWFLWIQSESAQGEAAASAMGGRGRGGPAFRGRGRGMRRWWGFCSFLTENIICWILVYNFHIHPPAPPIIWFFEPPYFGNFSSRCV